MPRVERLFKLRCDEVLAVASYYSMMPQFPAAIFDRREVFAPKQALRNAQTKLEELASRYTGKTLRMDNIRGLTLSFEKEGCLLFDPLSRYYTNDDTNQRFKEQLAKSG